MMMLVPVLRSLPVGTNGLASSYEHERRRLCGCVLVVLAHPCGIHGAIRALIRLYSAPVCADMPSLHDVQPHAFSRYC